MSSPFDDLNETVDPFADLSNVQNTPDTRSQKGIDRAARMAALATTDINQDAQVVNKNLEFATQKYQEIIKQSGEDSIRAQLAGDQQVADLAQFQEMFRNSYQVDPDGEVTKGAVFAANLALQEDIERRKEYVLEQEMIDKVQTLALSDPTQARILLDNMENGDAGDVIRDMNIKRLVLQREIDKAQADKDAQPWFADLVNFAATLIPGNISSGSVGNVDLDGITKSWLDNLFSGKRIQDESDSLYNLPAADFAKYVRDVLIPNVKENSTLLGLHDKSEQLNILTNLQNAPKSLDTNVFNALDNFGLVPFTKFAKGATSIPAMMAGLGARKESSSVLAQAAKAMAEEGTELGAKKTGVTVEEVQANMSMGATNTVGPELSVPLADEAGTILGTTEDILKDIPDLLQSQRLTEEELTRAIEATVKRAQASYQRPIKDVNVVDRLADGSEVNFVEITLGKVDGGGFSKKSGAATMAREFGFGDAQIFQDETGQWFAKVREPVVETGFYTNPLKVPGDNLVARYLLSQRIVGDKGLADAAQAAGNKKNKLLTSFVDNFKKDFVDKLRDVERGRVLQVLAAGSNEGKWWTDGQLKTLYRRAWQTEPTRREIDAYRAAVKINDIEYHLRNEDMWKQKVIKGFKTVSLDTGMGEISAKNAIVDREMATRPNVRVYDMTSGQHYTSDNPLTEARWEQLRGEGNALIHLEEPYQLRDGTTVKTIIARTKDLDIRELRKDQIKYRAGGHRIYEDSYFAKQTSEGVQPDTGKAFLRNPNVYMTGSKAEVDLWTKTMEQARLAAVKNNAGPAEIDAIFNGHPGFPSGKEFLDGLESGLYDKKHEFKTMFDRENPLEYSIPNADLSYVDLDEGGFNGFLRTTGRLYYGGKGEQLKDWRGALAPTLDPYQAINQSLKNIAQVTSFGDYKIQSIERFVETYKPFLNVENLPEGSSPYYIFNNAQVRTGSFPGRQKIEQQIKAQREIIKRTLGWKTELDLQQEQWVRDISEWVGGTDPNSIRSKAAEGFANWATTTNPAQKLKGMVFDLKLGLFNFTQFPLQLSTLYATTTLAGAKRGIEGLFSVVPIRSYLSKGGNENLLDLWVKRGMHKNLGFEPEEFKASMRSAKRSGFFDIESGTHQFQSDYGSHAAMSDFGNGVESFRANGRFFFNEGERWNRSAAWHVAWKETREKFPELDYNGAEFLTKTQGRAEEYAFSMSEQSTAWWQRGVMSIPTQFWAYNVRMLEAMMGPNFTAAQKTRLILGQGLLAGSAGIPGWGAVSEYFEAKNGEAFKPDTFYGAIDRGLLDTLVYHTTGLDFLAGERYGTGTWSSDLIREIMGASQYGEKPLIEVLGGPSFSVAKSVSEPIVHMLKYMSAESGGDLGQPFVEQDLIRLADTISTVGNLHKAWLVANYGTLVTAKGTTVTSGLPPQAAFMTALGVQPGQQDSISAIMGYSKNERKQVEDASRVIQNYRTRALNEPDKMDEYAAQINLYVNLLPPDIRQKALRDAHGKTDKSLYDSLAAKMQRENAQQEAINQLEEQ